MITTKDLTYQYPTKSNPIVFPDLNVQENSAIVITGKSGVGKTTFLHLSSIVSKLRQARARPPRAAPFFLWEIVGF